MLDSTRYLVQYTAEERMVTVRRLPEMGRRVQLQLDMREQYYAHELSWSQRQAEHIFSSIFCTLVRVQIQNLKFGMVVLHYNTSNCSDLFIAPVE